MLKRGSPCLLVDGSCEAMSYKCEVPQRASRRSTCRIGGVPDDKVGAED
jgi:hypothetical protein